MNQSDTAALEIFVVDVVPSLSTQELAAELETFLAVRDDRGYWTSTETAAVRAIHAADPFVAEVLAS